MVHFSDPECETVTCGRPYKFAILNSTQNSHLGNIWISPTWRIHFWSNLWGWKEDLSGYHSENFQTIRILNLEDTAEAISVISAEEIGKLGLPVLGSSLHCFQKRITLERSPWKGPFWVEISSNVPELADLGFVRETLIFKTWNLSDIIRYKYISLQFELSNVLLFWKQWREAPGTGSPIFPISSAEMTDIDYVVSLKFWIAKF